MNDLYEQWIGKTMGHKGQFIKKDDRTIFIGGPGSGGGEGGGSGGGVGDVSPVDSVTWAEGVVAARRLGGQVVPQRAVNQANRILEREGLKPTTRKAPKTYKDIERFYETTRPVNGDIWEGKGITVEVGKMQLTSTGKTAVDIFTTTSKGGRASTLYIDRDWINE